MSVSDILSEYPPKVTSAFGNILSSIPEQRFLQALVGSSGFEPPTLRLSGARSNHLSYEPISSPLLSFGGDEGIPSRAPRARSGSALTRPRRVIHYRPVRFPSNFAILFAISPFSSPLLSFGGDEGNRTLDPLLAGQVLSQLSYTPVFPLGTERTQKIEQQLRALFCRDS